MSKFEQKLKDWGNAFVIFIIVFGIFWVASLILEKIFQILFPENTDQENRVYSRITLLIPIISYIIIEFL